MDETEFLERIEAALNEIEALAEREAAASGNEVEPSRSGNVLTLEFENHSKIIVNSQAPLQEIWVAAKTGGFHFRLDGGRWRNTRDGTELFAALSQLIREQAA
jgi:CyaY protein